MRALSLVVVLLAAAAQAQVAGICGAGKSCTARSFKSTATSGHAFLATGGSLWCMDNVPNGSNPCTAYFINGLGAWQYVNGITAYFTINPGVGVSAFNNIVSTAGYVYGSTGLGSGSAGVGTAYASFPTCNGAATGRLLYDATNNLWRYCDGSNWRILMYDSAGGTGKVSPNFTGICFGTCSTESTNFTGAYRPVNDTKSVSTVTCSWGTAGTGGSTGVVVRVYDQTGGAELCSCTLGACTTAANTPLTCACAGALGSSKDYTVQLKSTTDCAGNPSNIVCNVE